LKKSATSFLGALGQGRGTDSHGTGLRRNTSSLLPRAGPKETSVRIVPVFGKEKVWAGRAKLPEWSIEFFQGRGMVWGE